MFTLNLYFLYYFYILLYNIGLVLFELTLWNSNHLKMLKMSACLSGMGGLQVIYLT